MATSIRPCFARVIEHVSAGVDITFGANTETVPTGVYANVIALLRELVAQSGGWIIDVRISDDIKIELRFGFSGNVVFDNTDLRDILGFTGGSLSVTSGNWYTATYTPLYIWYPEHTFADQGSFRKRSVDRFVGEKSLTGNVAGIGTGSTKWDRRIVFNAEDGARLGEELCTTTYEAERCLDTFFDGAMTSAPSVASHPCTKGFWYYQDINDFIEDCTTTGSEWEDNGGIRFTLSSSPDTYVFCNFEIDGLSDWRSQPFFVRSRLKYNVEISFTTAEAGTYS